MTTLTTRPYAGEMDLEAIAELINACEAIDRLEEGTSMAELRQEINAPSVDRTRDLCLWEDNDRLVAFGQLWIPESGDILDSFLWFRVHPTARGGDLEVEIVAWGEQRMREVAQERGVAVKLRSGTRETDRDRITLLESLGYICDRYFFRMGRSLVEPIPEPYFPPKYTLRSGAQRRDPNAWVKMYNESFIDHWNFHELTCDRLKHEFKNPYYNPEFDWVAIALDGTFASFCYCSINREENQRKQRNEGWIAVLGTRRGHRKQGLGRAMLLAGMQRLKAAGMDTALLGVDAQNPNGALRLYESVGFRQLHTKISLVKEL